ncbi:MAG: hypothetical protein FJY75_10105, partial [Candidatus Eisenbacteria bacterium]|nr:hypothetical protein [Candidatus Eisenbacteria bacterium]
AKLWLAHDGLWFQAVERRFGMETAIDCDRDAWSHFSPLEARRIMARLGLAPGGGLEALERALGGRLYALLNRQSCERPAADRLILRMESCRVQDARRRRGLPDFPCRSVGVVEYTTFAQEIDSRIETRCLHCPPDPPREDLACAWEFALPAGVPASGT